MKLISKQKVEDCFDGSAIFTYEVAEPWTAENIRIFESLGTLEFFKDFPRPLFRLRTPDGLFVSGVTGTTTCRVVLPSTNRDVVHENFIKIFE